MEDELFESYCNEICNNCIYGKNCHDEANIILLEEKNEKIIRCSNYIREKRDKKIYITKIKREKNEYSKYNK